MVNRNVATARKVEQMDAGEMLWPLTVAVVLLDAVLYAAWVMR